MTDAAMTDTVPATRTTKTESGTGTTVSRTRRPRATAEEESGGNARYFLAKANTTDGITGFGSGGDQRRRSAGRSIAAGSYLLRGAGISSSTGLCGTEAATQ